MNVLRVVPAFVLLAGLLAVSAQGADKIRVVTTTTDLKALTEAVGGGLVEVDALARGNQNPHDLEVRPSLMVKVRRADVLVLNGLELDQWADVVVQGANNPKVIPGAPGRVDASAGILVLEVPTTRVDRSDYELAERVAQDAGARAVLLATGVGAVKGAETYLDAIDYNVKALAQALK